jgi:hypothetical protein
MLQHSKPPNHPTPPMCCSSTASSPLFFDHNAHTPTKMSSKTRKTFVFLVYSYNLRSTDAKLLAHFAAYDPVSVFRGSHLVTGNRNICQCVSSVSWVLRINAYIAICSIVLCCVLVRVQELSLRGRCTCPPGSACYNRISCDIATWLQYRLCVLYGCEQPHRGAKVEQVVSAGEDAACYICEA